jgi:hypothetical protein
MTYWKDYPPAHVLVGAYLTGGKKNPAGKTRRQADANFGELSQAVALAGGSITKKLPHFYRA